MSGMDQIIDHAAELQRQVDELDRQVYALALVGIALAIAVTIMAVRLWRQ